jgi:hypothetical protein
MIEEMESAISNRIDASSAIADLEISRAIEEWKDEPR